jgi:hypothetical protein
MLGMLLLAIQLFLGVGLVWGCFTGLFSGEGRWDAASSRAMTASYLIGLLAGIAMLSNLFGFTNVPVVLLI